MAVAALGSRQARRLAVAIFVATCLSAVRANHYRGGWVRWKFLGIDPSDSNRVEIEVSHRIALLDPNADVQVCSEEGNLQRRDGGGDMVCVRDAPNLSCPSGVSPILDARYYNCTDYNPGVTWGTGVNSQKLSQSFPTDSSAPYFLGYAFCCWASNVPSAAAQPYQYGLFSSMILTPRSDNGQINSPPITSMFAEVPVQRGCTTDIRIPVVDEDDNDFVSCRQGTDINSREDSCYALCTTVGIIVNPEGGEGSCSIRVPPTSNSRSFRGLALVMEDSYTNGGAALSTVPLHFVLRSYGDQGVCLDVPTFVDSTPAFGAEVAAQGNTDSGTFDIVAQSSAAGLTITEIVTLSPLRTTKTALAEVADSGGRRSSMTVTFGQDANQPAGKDIMCFYAVQSNGITSVPHCVIVTYDGDPLDNPCDADPCENEAPCTPLAGNTDFQCACPVGYTGKTCDQVTCAKRCYTEGPIEGCYCDQACTSFGDCCDDFSDICMHDQPDVPGDATCSGRCYESGSIGGCFCDDLCAFFDDCCSDFFNLCPRPPVDDEPGAATCASRCYTAGNQGGCYCDLMCEMYNDCCSDFNEQCVRQAGDEGEATCSDRCFSEGSQGGCFCDSVCKEYNDCCDDFFQLCPRLEGSPCEPSLCQNDAACNAINDNTDYTCDCPPGFLGKNCQNENPCLYVPCMQDAPCTPLNENTDYSCDCPLGHLGKNCQNADPCEDSPCENDAPCTPLEENTDYDCDCPNGFVGKNCEIAVPIEPCTLDDICQNGGDCVPIGDFNYSCTCVPGFLGDNCENEYECPDGSAYAECITICDRHTCLLPDGPPGCDVIECTEGCLCLGDHLLEGDVCIPASQCGCEKDGVYYTLNTVLVDDNCTQECVCMSPNQFECAGLVCSQDASCQPGEEHNECTCDEGFTGNGFVCQPVDLQCRGYDDLQSCLGPDCRAGCFRSPNYPDGEYTPNTIVQYVVQVPGVSYYSIQCRERFDVEDDRDSLFVGPGEPPLLTDLEIEPSPPIRRLDGDEAPEKFLVDGSGFWMYFVADRIEQRQGFECCWIADDPCLDNPCMNGGSCLDRPDGSYVCVCVGGWTGDHCDLGRANCGARGDPHYTTFDGLKFDFQGACRYYLLQYCGDDDGVAYFDIVQKNRKLSTNSKAAVTRDLWIHIFGHEIGLLPDRELTLDGVPRMTPVNYPGFSITRSGNFLVATFNNSLEVMWDGTYDVSVALSYDFSNQTCGLCGNMDMDDSNEFVGPGFEPVDGPVEFGNSWKANPEECNADDETGGVHPCVAAFGAVEPSDEFSERFVSVLTGEDGPFSECHEVVDVDSAVEDALYDWCASMPDMGSTCGDLASYASRCQGMGVEVGPWRTADFCPLPCPANSMYNPCMTACPTMCGEEQPDDFLCPLPCLEGCECEAGHVLDGDGSCVPADACGCVVDGVYRQAGEQYLNEDCTMGCTCSDGGLPDCNAATCDPVQRRCGLDDDGIHGCHCNAGFISNGDNCVDDPCEPNPCENGGRCMPSDGGSGEYRCKCFRGFEGDHCDEVVGHCYAHGDPHYRSFDGVTFDYQGACKYKLVEPCISETDPDFCIVQENERVRPNGVGPSVTKAIYVQIGDVNVALKRDKKVYINGTKARPPISHGAITIKQQGKNLVLTIDSILTLRWNGQYDVDIAMSSQFFNNTCGLCGNWNGDPTDDLDGFDNPEAYGNNWAVAGQECVSDEEPTPFVCHPNPTVRELVEQVCGIVHSDAFSSCAGLERADSFFDDCVFDLCTTYPDFTNLCSSVSLYADLCRESGYPVGVWRSPQVCPFECPEHSHYSACTTPCPRTCTAPDAEPCPEYPCIEACECDNDDYVSNGEECVEVSECGCLDVFYREPGESYANQECTQWVTCNGQGDLSSVPQQCHSDATCRTEDGVHGCHCNEGYYGDGYTCQRDPCFTGEEHCSGNGRCVSDGDGEFHCECRRGWSGESCDTGMAVCSGHGDPHYTTFDGRRFDFQGDCLYKVFWTFLQDANTSVEVVADNDKYSMNSRVSLTRELLVIIGDLRIEFLQDREVRVNDIEVETPYSPWPGVFIKRAGKQLVLDTEFDIRVEWDGRNAFSIEVSADYFNQTQGLCGTYDEDRDNDFTTPDGDEAPDENSFGNSWVYGDCDSMEPPGDSYDPCEENEDNVDQAEELCGIITDDDGPFSDCHDVIDPQTYHDSCLYDLCSTLPQRGVLCEDVAKYADDCLWEGVDIEAWRSDNFCPFPCPEGSFYTLCAPGCPATCNDVLEESNATTCTQPCREGCECEEDKVLSGEECVAPEDCGCLVQGVYYKDGQDYLTADCQQRCVCTDHEVECSPVSCHENARCVVDDGRVQCQCQDPLIGDGMEVCDFNPCTLEPCQNGGSCFHFDNDDYWCECSDYWMGTNCEIRRGVCYSFGSQHYHLFDRLVYTFQGECQYVLAKTCPEDVMPSFEVIQDNQRLNAISSGIEAIHVRVGNNVFTLGPRRTVKFNGVEVNVPFSEDDVDVWFRGMDMVLKAEIGLEVVFDGWYGAKVLVHSDFANSLCGLCGNFNEYNGDDVRINEERVSFDDFAHHHRTDAPCAVPIEPPFGDTPNPCYSLSPEMRSDAEAFCNELNQGVFDGCPVNVFLFIRKCLFDVCASRLEDPRLSCIHPRYYPEVCRNFGGSVPQWRRVDFCPVSCPAGSHYEPRASPCPETCVDVRRQSSPECPRQRRVEGCVCDEGRVLSGTECVPPEMCGCYDAETDSYYLDGQLFMTEDCSMLCVCQSGTLSCSPVSCDENAECTVSDCRHSCKCVEGYLGDGMECREAPCNGVVCENMGTCIPGPNDTYSCLCQHGFAGDHCEEEVRHCIVYGVPHYTTFTLASYTFQGAASYFLTRNCNDTAEPPFEVVVKKERLLRNPRFTKTEEIWIRFPGTEIGLFGDHKITANGLEIWPPYEDEQVEIAMLHNRVIVSTQFGLAVEWDGFHSAIVVLSVEWAGKVCGLCGDMGGPVDDEIAAAILNPYDIAGFGDGNIAYPGDCPPATMPQITSQCSDEEQTDIQQLCSPLLQDRGPFRRCPLPLRVQAQSACAEDACAFVHDRMTPVCEAMSLVAKLCQRMGIDVDPWRIEGACPVRCPENAEFKSCADACQPRCGRPVRLAHECPFHCEEGCECDEGYVLDHDGSCVRPDDCGCFDDGFYHLHGEEYYRQGCQEICHCEDGEPDCEATTCHVNATCGVYDGDYGCHCNHGYMSNEAECVEDPCYPNPCENDGICVVQEEEGPPYKCVCRGRWKGEHCDEGISSCSVSGHTHYDRFDDEAFNFYGTCSYVLAEACGEPQNPFRIVLENEPDDEVPYLSRIEAVHIVIADQTIVLKRRLELVVNGEEEHLPYIQDDIKIYLYGWNLKVSTQFGLAVAWNGRDLVDVTLPSDYADDVCGLCGAVADQEPGLADYHNSHDFGTAWLHDPDECPDVGDFAETCENSTCNLRDAVQNCSILTSPRVACPLGWVTLPDDDGDDGDDVHICYYIEEAEESGLTYAAARHRCREVGGRLYDPRTEREARSFSNAFLGLCDGPFWLGCSDEGHESSWTCEEDGHSWHPDLPIGYWAWDEEQPDDGANAFISENCALIYDYDRWRDVSCHAQVTQLVCQLESRRDYLTPFKKCQDVVPPQPYFITCIQNLCVALPEEDTLCSSLTAYENICRLNGAPVGLWRSRDFCPLECPEGAYISECVSPCPPTCAQPDRTCALPCWPGCKCREDFVLQGHECVPRDECGCFIESMGRFIEPGSSFFGPECEELCHCLPGGSLDCQAVNCTDDADCVAHERRPGFTCQCDEGFVFMDNECQPDACAGVECANGGRCVALHEEYSCFCERGWTGEHCEEEVGWCRVQGFSHYRTFDGEGFNFFGDCIYHLAGHCGEDVEEPLFWILAKLERPVLRREVAALSYVEIYVDDKAFRLARGRVVTVDGIRKHLPITADGVRIHLVGNNVVFGSTAGVWVFWDGYGSVGVRVSDEFKNQTCGLCGNFDGGAENDLVPKDGDEVASAAEFGNSWEKDSDYKCRADDGALSPTFFQDSCGDGLQHVIDTCWAWVEHLSEPCGGSDFLDLYVHDCVADICLFGDPHYGCGYAAAAVEACRARGGRPPPRRMLPAPCRFECPANAEYSFCTSPCPRTCDDVPGGEGRPPCEETPCVEGCRCKEGYVLSGQHCVAEGECGCRDVVSGGAYFLDGEEFVRYDCQEKCECDDGVIECEPIECHCEAECRADDYGRYGCHCDHPYVGDGYICTVDPCYSNPCVNHGKCTVARDFSYVCVCPPQWTGENCQREQKQCSVYGSPQHFSTFDGANFNFFGTCLYTLAADCSEEPKFGVKIVNEPTPGRPGLTKVKDVYVYIEDGLVFGLHQHKKVTVNKRPVNLPYGQDDIHVVPGQNVLLTTPFGLTVRWNGYFQLDIWLDTDLLEEISLCGLCGNADGDSSNILDETPDGTRVSNSVDFGNSWRVPDTECADNGDDLQDACNGDIESAAAMLTCRIITEEGGPFAECIAQLDPAPYLENCVFTACSSGDPEDRSNICSSLLTLESDCLDLWLPVGFWRTPGFCVPPCGRDFQFKPSAPACPKTCLDVISEWSLPCPFPYQPGCVCGPYLYLSGKECVPKKECGCFYDGQYRKLHEVFLASDCQQECTCLPGNEVECRLIGCNPTTSFCGVEEGVYGCHCREGFENNGCGECRANPCYPNPCQNDASCIIIEDDDYLCQCPPGYGDNDCGADLLRCTVSGDPHVETFDGARYQFNGECEYILLHNCFEEDVDKFTVTQVTERSEENPNVVSTQMIKIYSESVHYGYLLELHRGLILLINGQRVTPPLILPRQQIHLSGSWMVLIDHNLDLAMRWDGYNHLDIFMHSKLGEVCGLCGFYDGDSSNEFLTRSGQFTEDVLEFVNSWALVNGTCDDAVDVPNGCEGDDGLLVMADNACNAIRDVVGHFAACHDVIPFQPFYDKCIFDICKSLPDTSARCAHIQDYAQRCINAGVEVGYEWRIERNCFSECPQHSHFSSCIGSCPPSCLGERLYQDPRRCFPYCNDGCECDEGYYLSDDRCVAEEECGCLVPHQISQLAVIPVGYTYLTEGCEESCTCGADGTQVCVIVTCHASAACEAVDGVLHCVCQGSLVGDGLQCSDNPCDSSPCQNSGTCHVNEDFTHTCVCRRGWTGESCSQETLYCLTYGDPHYRTFDGVFYDFMGECSYYLVRDCANSLVSVVQVNERVVDTLYTYMKELIVNYMGMEIKLVPDVGVLVDGVPQSPVFALSSGAVQVRQVGNYIVVQLRDLLDLKWDGRYGADIELMAPLGSVALCGLCGNGNGNDNDDFDDLNPFTVDTAVTFGNNQVVGNCAQSTEQGHQCQGENDFADAVCQQLDTSFDDFPFQSCTEFAGVFHTACRYDVCAVLGTSPDLAIPLACGVIGTHAQLCQDLGYDISEWRSDLGVCSQTCPRNAEYSLCADPCPISCRDPDGAVTPCVLRCAEGCTCREGYYQDGDDCVPRSQCGCLYDGGEQYLKLSEAYYDDTCSMRCACSDAFGSVECVSAACHENATCTVVNSFNQCVCDEGFAGDGQDCVFAECADDPCADDTQCLRRQGSGADFVCECVDNLMMGKACDVPADYNNRFACYGATCAATTFESLNYPELPSSSLKYPDSHKAFYQLWVPGADYFRVTFAEIFEVEQGKDFLYVGPGFQYPRDLDDGPISTIQGVVYQLGGYQPPGPIYIIGDAVWMFFETDDQINLRGWQAELEAAFEGLQGSPVCWDGSQTRLSGSTWDYGKCDECECGAGASITCSLNATAAISCEGNNDCPAGSNCVPPDQVPLCVAEPCDGMYCDVGALHANCADSPNCATLLITAELISLAPDVTLASICQSLITAAELLPVPECLVFECAVQRDARRKRSASDETVQIEIFLESGSPVAAPVSQDGLTPVEVVAVTLYKRLTDLTGGSLPINITDVIYLGRLPVSQAPPTSAPEEVTVEKVTVEKVTVKKVTAGPVDLGMPASTIAAIAAGAAAITLLLGLVTAAWCRRHSRRSAKKTMTFQEASEEGQANQSFEMVDHGPAFSRAIPLDDGTGHQGNVYGVKYDMDA